MQVVMQDDQYDKSRIVVLPFINLDPGNLSTIYTALCFAQQQCEMHKLKVCPVTFDQPLYIKAAEIVASSPNIKNIFIRLGGFHLLMSYLGSIGQIMNVSGLETLWEAVYAKGTIVHMLSGHAFSRALRAHILTLVAIITVVVDCSLQTIDTESLRTSYKNIFSQEQKVDEVVGEESINNFTQTILELLSRAADKSRTGKLWVQYTRQVTLLQNFIRTKRTGNWDLHLHCVREMVPYFHAAGHLHYAKAVRLFAEYGRIGEHNTRPRIQVIDRKRFLHHTQK